MPPSQLVRTAVSVAALSAVAAGVGAVAPAATASSTATPLVVQSLSATTAATRVVLPTWTPACDDLLLVAVATQAYRNVPVAVSGHGLAFQRVTQVRNAQGIGLIDVFRAQGACTADTVRVALPGNAGAASVVAMRVAGVAVGGNGASAVRAVGVEDGPTALEGDNANMTARVASTVGDLVLGLGTNRTRRFVAPSGQTALKVDVATGQDGQRVAVSAWSRTATTSETTVGAARDLTGGSGTDDWAVSALALRATTTDGVAALPVPSPSATIVPAPTSSPSPSPTTPTPTTSPSRAATSPTAPTTVPGAGVRPYGATSPWNTPIVAGAPLHSNSAGYIRAIADNGLPLTSDVDQYTIPVYAYDASTPRRTVRMSGYFSSYDAGDSSRVGYGFAPIITGVPVPSAAEAGVGSDGQIVFWDAANQTEYSFWQFGKDAAGNYTASNGYRYHTGPDYMGRFADGLAGRGAGMPYLAGLVRKWEVDQGRIDHALAFAYHAPSPEFVFPATKSDGGNFGGVAGVDIPEGSRLQLNPTLTDADLAAYGLSQQARVIARALQAYGMYVVDNSGSSKVYVEDRRTAGWDNTVTRNLLSGLPWSQFRVLK